MGLSSRTRWNPRSKRTAEDHPERSQSSSRNLLVLSKRTRPNKALQLTRPELRSTAAVLWASPTTAPVVWRRTLPFQSNLNRRAAQLSARSVGLRVGSLWTHRERHCRSFVSSAFAWKSSDAAIWGLRWARASRSAKFLDPLALSRSRFTRFGHHIRASPSGHRHSPSSNPISLAVSQKPRSTRSAHAGRWCASSSSELVNTDPWSDPAWPTTQSSPVCRHAHAQQGAAADTS